MKDDIAMINNVPLLSIVIPTRNRLDYVKFAIQSVLSIPSPQLQLAVEDNSDLSLLEEWLKDNITDKRLVYRYSRGPVSMNENYDRAMGLANGEYITLIGDDDGVNPEIMAAARWAHDNSLDALVPTSLINYVWPDLHMTSAGSMAAGELSIRAFSGRITFPDPEIEMMKCVRDAGQNFHMLPKAYYGIVRKKCLDAVRERTGTYFPGVSPDMAVAISVANYVKRMCHVDYPLFVPGSSAKSNAGLSGLNKHIGRLRDQPHLPATCEDEWSGIVPRFYSVQTIWAEAAVGALRAVGRNDLLTAFNVPLLYAYCLIFHYKYMKRYVLHYYAAFGQLGGGRIIGTLKFIYWFTYCSKLAAKRRISRYVHKPNNCRPYCKRGLQNIDEAVQSVSSRLRELKCTFAEIVK